MVSDVIGFLFSLISLVFFIRKIVPHKRRPLEVAIISLILGLIGAAMWYWVLIQLKRFGLEPESADSFGGGPNEANFIGGACLGLVYFFPIALWISFVDTKHNGDSFRTSLRAFSAFLFGSTIGSASFYGSHIRAFITDYHWSYLHQESIIVLIWSGLIFGCAYSLYAISISKSTHSPVPSMLLRAMAGLALSMSMCFITVYYFTTFLSTPTDHLQRIRGIAVAIAMFPSIAFAHEIIRSSFSDMKRNFGEYWRSIKPIVSDGKD